MPEGTIVINDIVRGEVSFNTAELGDFIIIKSDGFPTYNFACVIDDHLMGITHVIRGQEHLMNTPGQQALWQALGFGNPPKYAHMSVTISESGGKLSKRERPQTLRKAIKAKPDIDLEKLAGVGGLNADEMNDFLKGESVPDVPAIEAMAKYLGVAFAGNKRRRFLQKRLYPRGDGQFSRVARLEPRRRTRDSAIRRTHTKFRYHTV